MLLSGSSTSSSTVATVTVALALPAANVAEVGVGPLTMEPSSRTHTGTVSACATLAVRITWNSRLSPSR